LFIRKVTEAGVESLNQMPAYTLKVKESVGDISGPNMPTIEDYEIEDGGYLKVSVSLNQENCLSRANKIKVSFDGVTETRSIDSSEEEIDLDVYFSNAVRWGIVDDIEVWAEDSSGRSSEIDSYEIESFYIYNDYSDTYNTFPAAQTSTQAKFASDDTSWTDITYEVGAGRAIIKFGDDILFYSKISDWFNETSSPITISTGSITAGTCAAPIERIDEHNFYFCANGKRVAHFDAIAGILTVPMFVLNSPLIYECPLNQLYYDSGTKIYWQIFDMIEKKYRPWMMVSGVGSGSIHFYHDVNFTNPSVISFVPLEDGPFKVEVFTDTGMVEWTWDEDPIFSFDLNNKTWNLHDYHMVGRPAAVSLISSDSTTGYEVINDTAHRVHLVARGKRLSTIDIDDKIFTTGCVDTASFQSALTPVVVFVNDEGKTCFWNGKSSETEQIVTYLKNQGVILEEMESTGARSVLNLNDFTIIQGE
jgi:hypothetical protein